MTAEELRLIRTRLRLSRTRFARAFDVDRRTYYRWEHGVSAIPRQVAVLSRAARKYASVRAELGIEDSAQQKLNAIIAAPRRPARG